MGRNTQKHTWALLWTCSRWQHSGSAVFTLSRSGSYCLCHASRWPESLPDAPSSMMSWEGFAQGHKYDLLTFGLLCIALASLNPSAGQNGPSYPFVSCLSAALGQLSTWSRVWTSSRLPHRYSVFSPFPAVWVSYFVILLFKICGPALDLLISFLVMHSSSPLCLYIWDLPWFPSSQASGSLVLCMFYKVAVTMPLVGQPVLILILFPKDYNWLNRSILLIILILTKLLKVM